MSVGREMMKMVEKYTWRRRDIICRKLGMGRKYASWLFLQCVPGEGVRWGGEWGEGVIVTL